MAPLAMDDAGPHCLRYVDPDHLVFVQPMSHEQWEICLSILMSVVPSKVKLCSIRPRSWLRLVPRTWQG